MLIVRHNTRERGSKGEALDREAKLFHSCPLYFTPAQMITLFCLFWLAKLMKTIHVPDAPLWALLLHEDLYSLSVQPTCQLNIKVRRMKLPLQVMQSCNEIQTQKHATGYLTHPGPCLESHEWSHIHAHWCLHRVCKWEDWQLEKSYRPVDKFLITWINGC